MQFNLVVCGLDSVEARRWINATLVNMVDPENPESLKPLIDGGTEGAYSAMCYLVLYQDLTPHRFQRTGSRYSAHRDIMLRVFIGHAQ